MAPRYTATPTPVAVAGQLAERAEPYPVSSIGSAYISASSASISA